ncbi:MAG: 4Fe-4S dicluster domain-containing protein, partial [Clostridia bacterium]|nr:4Fe-4S dicluster domain-containing protein [Clostridia bacterium]
MVFSSRYRNIYSEASACIRCGRCVDACPMNIIPGP